MKQWTEYLQNVSLFNTAIRLRHLIWAIKRYVPEGSRVLEVGTGSGATAVLLADLGYNVVAVDIEHALLERVRQRYQGFVARHLLQVTTADMRALPWASRAFDLAFHQGVLEHFEDDTIVAALKEQARIACRVIIDVPNHRYTAHPFGDERLLTPTHWRRLIEEAGLRLIGERGRLYRDWIRLLPYVLFSHRFTNAAPAFSKHLGLSSIFVCESVEFSA